MSRLSVGHRYCLDPVADPYRRLPAPIFRRVMKITRGAVCRDDCRSPMQRTGAPNAGFCPPEVRPWLPVCPDYREVNVETLSKEPDSVYGCYRRFLELRRRAEELRSAPLALLPEGQLPAGVLGFRRGGPAVLLNFSPHSRPVGPALLAGCTIVVSTRAGELQPWGCGAETPLKKEEIGRRRQVGFARFAGQTKNRTPSEEVRQYSL